MEKKIDPLDKMLIERTDIIKRKNRKYSSLKLDQFKKKYEKMRLENLERKKKIIK